MFGGMRRLLSLLFPLPIFAQLPAFPGAEGYGAYATGGRGGDVYTVTNLNTSGAGSFAEAIATVPAAGRTIVFAVSGHIHVNKTTLSKSKVTIAGQTAPGDGIGFKDGTFIISGDDIVVRHTRFRYGKKAAGGDCVNLTSGTQNAILDSVSLQFSTDENISSFSSPPENLTMQWALNGWGLESHSCGGLWDQNHASCHHTLWSHNHTRNPKARPNGLLEWVNNVTFDWDIGFIMGDSQTPAAWKANVIGCYFLCPPGNVRSKALEKASLDRNGVPNFSVHLANCRHDSNVNGLLDGTDKGYGIVSGTSYHTMATPIANPGSAPISTDDPTVAFKKIVSKAGALRLDVGYTGPLRDEVDARLVQNLTTQTRQHISSEASLGLGNGGFGVLNSTAAPADADKDGMPDFWEQTLGYASTTQDHNTALPTTGTYMPVAGYTRLEEYLHFKSMPHAVLTKNTALTVDLAKYTSGFTASPLFTAANMVGGTVSIVGTTATFTPTNNFTGRAKFDFTVTDAAGHTWTQTCAILITSNAAPRDLKWKGDGAANTWDLTAPNWSRSGVATSFSNAFDNVTFDDTGSRTPSVKLTGTMPVTTDMLVQAAGNYTLGEASAAQLTVLGTLTKRGSGSLTLAHSASTIAKISLEEGTLAMAAGAHGTAAVSMQGTAALSNVFPSATTNTLGMSLEVATGATPTLNTGNRLTLSGALTGSGTLNCNVQTTVNRFDLKGATGAFAGTLEFTGSGGTRLFFNGGSFNGFDNAAVKVGSGVSLQPQTNSGGNTCNTGSLSGLGNLQGGSAGAVNYAVGAKNADTTFAGVISGNSMLTKQGTGTLVLTGANSHSGATAVNAGSLTLNGSTTSPITVANGAVLRGIGTANGSVTLQPGAQLSPGAASGLAGEFTVANSLTAVDSTFSLQLSNSPTGSNDKVKVTGGTATLTGTNTFNIRISENGLGAGTYSLLEAPSLTAGTLSLLLSVPVGIRQSFALTKTPTAVQLGVTGNVASLVWSGSGNAGTWDLNSTANFTGGYTFYNLDSVLCNDTAASRVVTVAGTLVPSITTVNTTAGYTFGGTGTLDGRLVKIGSGALTLSGPQVWSGGITLEAGTIVLANETANASGLGTGVVTVNGGTISMRDDSATYNDFTAQLHVPGRARLNADSRCDIRGTLTGSGILDYYTPFTRSTLLADWSDFTGTINVLTDASGGDFRIGTSYTPAGYAQASIALSANIWMYYSGTSSSGEGTTIDVGELSGPATAHLRGGVTGYRNFAYRIGGKTAVGAEVVFAGDIAEQNATTTTTYTKVGAGTWRLSGSGTWNGGTEVEAGTLRLWPSTVAGFSCVGATNVAPGATLDLGAGKFATEAVNIAPGASLLVQDDFEIVGDLNLDGSATILAGEFNVSGNVVNNGSLRLQGMSTLRCTGEFTNNGLLDLLTSNAALPANFQNNGTVILNTDRRILSASRNGSSFTAEAMGYPGHTYQLQSSPSLAGPWTDTSSAATGTGVMLSLTDPNASQQRKFYRLAVRP
jgi:autotransporter-associated beta strand protein